MLDGAAACIGERAGAHTRGSDGPGHGEGETEEQRQEAEQRRQHAIELGALGLGDVIAQPATEADAEQRREHRQQYDERNRHDERHAILVRSL